MAQKAAPVRGPKRPALVSIDLDKLRYDERNPRIVRRVGRKASQDKLYDLLVSEMDARELIPSFITNGYLPYEPLILRAREDGTYTVIEGNRRVAALRTMKASDDIEVRAAFSQHGLAKVPSILFTGSSKDELAYLGLRHISKTKDWSPEAKAAFVERLLVDGLSLEEAGRVTNTGTTGLRNLVLVLRLFERANGLGLELPADGSEGATVFWHLGDAVRRTNTKTYLELIEDPNPLEQPQLNESKLERLISWVYGNKKTGQSRLIRNIRDIPTLDDALAHPASRRALEGGADLETAIEENRAAGAGVSAHLTHAKTSIQKATSRLSELRSEGVKEVRDGRDDIKRACDLFDSSFESVRKSVE